MFVAVVSRINDAENLRSRDEPEIQYEQRHPMGYRDSAIGIGDQREFGYPIPEERDGADVLELSPTARAIASSPAGFAIVLGWRSIRSPIPCGVHQERDGLCDNLPPDYITSVQSGGFYGWPWFYIGDHEDPHHRGEHPELKAKVIIPDVLLEAHSASLEMTFLQRNAVSQGL
jgi:hypothetical protein